VVRRHSPNRNLDSVHCPHDEQAQIAIERVQVDDLVKGCAWLKIVSTRHSERDEVRTWPVITDPLEPFEGARVIGTDQAPADHQRQLVGYRSAGFVYFIRKMKNPPI
jgi:hypothetical protein